MLSHLFGQRLSTRFSNVHALACHRATHSTILQRTSSLIGCFWLITLCRLLRLCCDVIPTLLLQSVWTAATGQCRHRMRRVGLCTLQVSLNKDMVQLLGLTFKSNQASLRDLVHFTSRTGRRLVSQITQRKDVGPPRLQELVKSRQSPSSEVEPCT